MFGFMFDMNVLILVSLVSNLLGNWNKGRRVDRIRMFGCVWFGIRGEGNLGFIYCVVLFDFGVGDSLR